MTEGTLETPEDILLPRSLNRSLPMALLRAREAVASRFRPLLMEHSLTDPQWRVLRVLGEQSPLDATEVAARANVLAPSLTRIVKLLEERGLVTRCRDENDARRTALRITVEGTYLIGQVTPEINRLYAELIGHYGAERVETLLDMLNDLAQLKSIRL